MGVKKARYSFAWAYSRAEELERKYPRATELVLELYGINLREFSTFLAFGDPLWNVLRSRVHYWDRDLRYRAEKYYTGVTLFEVEKVWVNRFSDEKRLLDRLTATFSKRMLKEQGLKGAVDGSCELLFTASRDSLPSIQGLAKGVDHGP